MNIGIKIGTVSSILTLDGLVSSSLSSFNQTNQSMEYNSEFSVLCSSMHSWTPSLLLPRPWDWSLLYSLTIHWMWRNQRKIEVCHGGWNSEHLEVIIVTKNSTLCLLISTDSFLLHSFEGFFFFFFFVFLVYPSRSVVNLYRFSVLWSWIEWPSWQSWFLLFFEHYPSIFLWTLCLARRSLPGRRNVNLSRLCKSDIEEE